MPWMGMTGSSRPYRHQRVVSCSARLCKESLQANAPEAKPGQKTLAELDHYRYTDAPALFALNKPSPRLMQLQDVQTLVEWKLSVAAAP